MGLKKITVFIARHIESILLSLASLIFLVGLFINLGKVPVMSDEGVRGLVVLEMQLSGDYLTPTLNGEPYYNKPPLYNWIILAFYRLTDSQSLFVLRLPNMIALILFTLTVFLFVGNNMIISLRH